MSRYWILGMFLLLAVSAILVFQKTSDEPYHFRYLTSDEAEHAYSRSHESIRLMERAYGRDRSQWQQWVLERERIERQHMAHIRDAHPHIKHPIE